MSSVKRADSPPPAVLGAFGASGPLEPLSGGQGTAFRAGGIVLKPVSNAEEAEWSAALYERVESPGFRVPRPVRTRDGSLIAEGWCAYQFIDAHHAGRNGGRWPETLAACRAFHAALVGVPRPAFLAARDDGWSQADRIVFGELDADPLPFFSDPIVRLTALLRPAQAPSQLIHGDFTANVLFAEGQPPCVIDFTPYWRPVPFGLAVVVSDAISWTGADPEIIHLCDDVPDFRQWLVRATLRRVWELERHARAGWPNREDYLHEYLPLTALLERSSA